MRGEQLRPVVDRLLATRRAKVEETQNGTRKGLRVLFTGQSGKNKLLAAQLFAHELSVDLFEIDLQRLVSKYVGDTEKNLDALFQAAEASDAVLLFDDTDHLFGEAAPPSDDSEPLREPRVSRSCASASRPMTASWCSARTTARTSTPNSRNSAMKSSI